MEGLGMEYVHTGHPGRGWNPHLPLTEARSVINNHWHVAVECFVVVTMIRPCFLQQPEEN